MTDQSARATFVEPLRDQLLSECQVMVRCVLSSGRELPKAIVDVLDILEREPELAVELPTLAAMYAQLLRIVSPATPAGLRLVQEDEQNHKFLHTLGPVPSIRYLMLAAFLFFAVFIGFSLFEVINRATMSEDIYDMHGLPLLIVLVFLLSAAGLGATFGALFDAYQYISEGSYDTKYDSLYWARIGLGLMSGLMLSQLVPQPPRDAVLERPLLALLGGFSAAVVHQILHRLVGTLNNLFAPEPALDPMAHERAMRERVTEEQGAQRASLGRSFDELLDGIAAGGGVPEARRSLVKMLSDHPSDLAGLSAKAARAHARTAKAQPGNTAESAAGTPVKLAT